jgi:hypothetical protein
MAGLAQRGAEAAFHVAGPGVMGAPRAGCPKRHLRARDKEKLRAGGGKGGFESYLCLARASDVSDAGPQIQQLRCRFAPSTGRIVSRGG